MVKLRRGRKEDKKNYLKFQLDAFPNEDGKRHNNYFDQKIKRKEIFVAELDGKYIGHLTYSVFVSPPFY